jgi:nitroreductase
MLLAIHALGLGGVWLGVHPQRPYYKDVKSLLNVPADMRVVSLIAAGRPRLPLPPRAAPQERFEEEKWHKERYL